MVTLLIGIFFLRVFGVSMIIYQMLVLWQEQEVIDIVLNLKELKNIFHRVLPKLNSQGLF